MACIRYIQEKRKRNSERGKYGNEVKRQKMLDRASEMKVTGTIKTSGIFGNHLIEFLDFDDERLGYVRFDGELRRPRTPDGFARLFARWIWNKKSKITQMTVDKPSR